MTRSRAGGGWSIAALLLLVGAAACTGATSGSGAPAPAPRDVLVVEEIQRTAAVTAYDAVRQLRPQWLRRRGRSSIQNATAEVLVVYLDGARFGGPDALRSVAAGSVLEIRHLDARDATTRFGTGHAGGALLVRTK